MDSLETVVLQVLEGSRDVQDILEYHQRDPGVCAVFEDLKE
jgi:hypothetical protein